METSDKQRFEMHGGLFSALYGHSTPQRLPKVPSEPPAILYHGTAPQTAQIILTAGLKPMGHQYVYLSADRGTAYQVGHRKARQPVILQAAAAEAHAAGVIFYKGNEQIWLADYVPAIFICLAEAT